MPTPIKAGMKSIRQGHVMDEEAAEMIAKNDVWLSPQPLLDDEEAAPFPQTPNRAK